MGRAAKDSGSHTDNPSGSALKRRIAEYGPFAILLLVAFAQIRITQIDHLTPAKGGGFGMFSTVDRLVNRIVRVYAVGPNFNKGITQPRSASLAKDVRRAAALPVRRYLKRVADGLSPATFPAGTLEVGVEVWKLGFDPDTLQVRRIRIGSYRRPVAVETGSRFTPSPKTTKRRPKGASR